MTIINVAERIEHPQDLKPVLQLEQLAILTNDRLIDTRFAKIINPGPQTLIYFKTPSLEAAINLARHIKEKHNTHIIGIGPHATQFPESLTFKNSPFDSVLSKNRLAESIPMIDIINCTGKGSIDKLPVITDYTYLYKSTYPTRLILPRYGYLLTSYGCNHSCSFCTPLCIKETGARKFRTHSVDYIISAIEKNIAAGKNIIHFIDDNFTHDRTRVLTLCKDIKKKGLRFKWIAQGRVDEIDGQMLVEMKNAGCECLKLGVESGSPKDLIRLNKTNYPEKWVQNYCTIVHSAKKINLPIIAMFMFGIPGQDSSDRKQTMELIETTKPFLIQLHKLVDYKKKSEEHHYSMDKDMKKAYWQHLRKPETLCQHIRYIPHYLRTLPTTIATLRLLSKRI